ncbi:MAG TPA: HupE/UreJ family protein [Planctomycetota bacterium]|nr:HupE/UreJ family protein [Planctomycetota bacterium]
MLGCTSLLAHPGHGADSFSAGAAHPLAGADHVLAMLAIGLWAAQIGGRAMWIIPGTFIAAMLGGGLLAFSGMSLPMVEGGIAASVLVLGLVVACAWKATASAGVALAMVFALFHGYAHSAEMSENAWALGYSAGFVFSTALLHASGLGLALVIKQVASEKLVRVSGGAIALCALPMIAGLM